MGRRPGRRWAGARLARRGLSRGLPGRRSGASGRLPDQVRLTELKVLLKPPRSDTEELQQKFQDVLVKGVGMSVIAIAARETMFPTIRIPDAGDLAPFVQMAAGWNVLVDVGLALGVNLDKPQRARKVGNEFVG